MGTSKGYITPTNIPWQKAKRAVTSYIKELSSSDKLSRAVNRYASAKVSDASNYQIISKGISKVADILRTANTGNLNYYLEQIHRDDLVGKSAEEIFTALLNQDDDIGGSVEGQMLINTLPKVLENLDVITIEDLQRLTPTDFMIEFLSEYICNDFDRCFDEQIRRHILPRDYDRIAAKIHGYIKNSIYEMKEKVTTHFTSFDDLVHSDLVSSCIKDAYRIFTDIYASEV